MPAVVPRMQMDGWTDHLHIALFGEHVLFPSLRLDSGWHFIVASLFTATLCFIERCVARSDLCQYLTNACVPLARALTLALSKNWTPFAWTRQSRARRALWKSMLYWVVTFDRL